jgi:hypothetical protein
MVDPEESRLNRQFFEGVEFGYGEFGYGDMPYGNSGPNLKENHTVTWTDASGGSGTWTDVGIPQPSWTAYTFK